MATQVPMTFLGWALKSLVAVGVLCVAWTFILNQVIEQIAPPSVVPHEQIYSSNSLEG